MNDILDKSKFEKLMGSVRLAIVCVYSLKGFLRKCKDFCEWMTFEGKIIYLINAGDKGVYETDLESEVKNEYLNLFRNDARSTISPKEETSRSQLPSARSAASSER